MPFRYQMEMSASQLNDSESQLEPQTDDTQIEIFSVLTAIKIMSLYKNIKEIHIGKREKRA